MNAINGEKNRMTKTEEQKELECLKKKIEGFTFDIEEQILFNERKNVPDLYKTFTHYKNRHLIYFMQTLLSGAHSLAGLESLENFVNKLVQDDDFIQNVGKNYDETFVLFDPSKKLPQMFGILFVDGKYKDGRVINEKSMWFVEGYE